MTQQEEDALWYYDETTATIRTRSGVAICQMWQPNGKDERNDTALKIVSMMNYHNHWSKATTSLE